MRIIKRAIDRFGNGAVVLVPTDEEDLWHLYNIISRGDAIRAGTFRKVKNETKTGSVSSDKVFIIMKMQVVDIKYYGEDNLELVLKGKNLEENRFLQVGQFQTISVELNYPITIYKNNWDKMHMETLRQGTDVSASADTAAIIMDEGTATLCFMKSNITQIKAKIEKNIPKKFSGIFHYDKAIKSFFEMCLQAIIKGIDFNQVKLFIVASPGIVRDEFLTYMSQQAERPEYSILKANQSKIVSVKTSTGYKGSLSEALADATVMAKLKDTKAYKEVEVLDRFFKVLKADTDKVAYGHKYVMEASDHKAIQDLLISDNLFKTRNLQLRKTYVNLIDQVKDCGGNVYLFSIGHLSGEKLNDLSGIAAILRFPMNMDYLDEKEDVITDQPEEEEKEFVEGEEKLEDVSGFVHNDDMDKEFFESLNQGKEAKFIPDKEKDKEREKEKHQAEKEKQKE
jgi:protein pelota